MNDFSAVRDDAVRLAAEATGPAAATFARTFLHTASQEDIAAFPARTLVRLMEITRDLGVGRSRARRWCGSLRLTRSRWLLL